LESRAEYTVRFPDGGTLELGPRTAVMGVLNATPDSFSDGGRYRSIGEAVDAGLRMADAGARILDVGGESTRPGADEVPVEEELRRVVPIVEALARATQARISIDTRRAEVARAALDAGAHMINDVSGLRDPSMLPLLVERQVPVVVMHMRGTPRTMQDDTRYRDVVETVVGFLRDRSESAVAAGLPGDRMIVDPGIGFGKSIDGNLTILRRLPELRSIGRPILIGASRKSFIGRLLEVPVDQRLAGSVAVAAYASAQGAHVIRAHDVEDTVRALRVIDAIRAAGTEGPAAPRPR